MHVPAEARHSIEHSGPQCGLYSFLTIVRCFQLGRPVVQGIYWAMPPPPVSVPAWTLNAQRVQPCQRSQRSQSFCRMLALKITIARLCRKKRKINAKTLPVGIKLGFHHQQCLTCFNRRVVAIFFFPCCKHPRGLVVLSTERMHARSLARVSGGRYP